jgi:Tfp pilus assembly protein PilP
MAQKKIPLVKKLIVVGGALIALQFVYIFVFSRSSERKDIKTVINEQVSKNTSLDSERKEMVKIQVALSSFRVKNNRYPKQLNELVPDYLDTIPLDPKTGVAYKYTVTGDNYTLGDAKLLAKKDTDNKGAGTSVGNDEQSQLIAFLDETKQEEYVYDSTGKKDPFRSHDFSPKVVEGNTGQPLEQYSYSQLKLSAILEGGDSPKAMIEDITGKGHVVTIGARVGNTGGTIAQIEKDKVIIIEKTVEFTGETSTRTVELLIRRDN